MMRGLFVSLCVAWNAFGNEAFFNAEVVDAVAVSTPPSSVRDVVWKNASEKVFRLAPQRAVFLHDKKANEIASKPANTKVQVKSVVAKESLWIRLEWEDATEDRIREDESNAFADSVALQIPQKFGAGLRLPAISMGDDAMPVNLTLLRASPKGALESQIRAAGFGSSTRQGPATLNVNAMEYDASSHRWAAVLSLPLPATQALVPVAFAVWEGQRMERSGYKRLSSWHFVKLPGRSLDANYVKEMSFGYHQDDLGNAQQGKALVQAVCASCHHMPGVALAARGVAPSLEDVGAVATASYLRDSVVNPNEVVLYEPNPNQHYDRSGKPDKNGAFTNSDAFRWSTVDADGKRISKMPTFSHLPKEQVANIVAYLKSLNGETQEAK